MISDGSVWVRVGGGCELIPGGARHGPADPELPPPNGPWRAVALRGEVAGWVEPGSQPPSASALLEAGEELAERHREHLLGRLDHKLRSSVLALQESARAAAFGRPEMLEAVHEQAQEVGRRAAALAAAALPPKEHARPVVLAAAVRNARLFSVDVPGEAIVRAPEPLLADVLNRLAEWTGSSSREVTAVPVSHWWRVAVRGHRAHLEMPELGEPLLRHLVDMQLQGWLDVSREDETAVFLPSGG